jgi:type VI secretion system protein ImpK
MNNSSSMSVPLPAPGIDAKTDMGARLTAVLKAENPLIEAAHPLLRALADMPEHLESDAIPLFRSMIEQEVRVFQKLCEQANIRRDHMLGARYCLCTALDEAAMQTAWAKEGTGSLGAWIRDGLATTFHEDRQGGDKVYLLIGRLMTEPQEHLDLLEVIYRILCLGFEGRYRLEPDGRRKHEHVRQRLHTEITAQRRAVMPALSPNGLMRAAKRRFAVWDVPVWLTCAVLAFVAFVLFAWFRYQLSTHDNLVRQQISDIGHLTPPPIKAELHLKDLLRNEIAAGTVSVDEDGHRSVVTFHGDEMFPAGKETVQPDMAPLLARIAAEINKVPGKVTITGYTDNRPVHSRQFASNQALSEERATQVMQTLQAAGVPAKRFEVQGNGEADPIADNATPQGRAKNRRVEIAVEQ